MALLKNNIEVTGMGVIAPTAIGLDQFETALKNGKTNFSTIEFELGNRKFRFPVARVDNFNFHERITEINLNEEVFLKVKRLRNISLSTSFGLYCALEAWADAGLENAGIDLSGVAIILGGSNTQQATLQAEQNKYRENLQFLNPNYGLNFYDTNLIGVLSEVLSIRGEGYSIGASSASGNMAIIQAHRLISSNEYDVVLVVAPLMDISVYEYQGFTSLGAMAVFTENANPAEICRPFDKAHA